GPPPRTGSTEMLTSGTGSLVGCASSAVSSAASAWIGVCGSDEASSVFLRRENKAISVSLTAPPIDVRACRGARVLPECAVMRGPYHGAHGRPGETLGHRHVVPRRGARPAPQRQTRCGRRLHPAVGGCRS